MTSVSAAATSPLGGARLRPAALVAGVGSVLVAVVAGLALGPVGIAPEGVMLQLLDAIPGIDVDSGLSDLHVAIVEEIRLPRVVLGLLVGATLSMSGAAYQGPSVGRQSAA